MQTMQRSVAFYDAHPRPADLRAEVLAGLGADPKALSPKFFYDARGSRLFDAICELPEYYPTRTELSILRNCAAELAGLIGPGCTLIEPGSGSSVKVRVLLENLKPAAYVPMDICREHVWGAAQGLAEDYPWLRLHAVCTDFALMDSVPLPEQGRRVAFFPGSTIGNFEPHDAAEFLRTLAAMVGEEGAIIIGVDLKKDPAVLHAAYNDSRGVTAEFNLNLLARINRELGARFDRRRFRHRAFYDGDKGRVEMHLVSTDEHCVPVDGHEVAFADGEHIHTENSYKYSLEEFAALAQSAGCEVARAWTDPARLFSVQYLVPVK